MTDRGKIKISEHQAYMPGTEGPFKCKNCEYYAGTNACNNDKIISYAENEKFGLKLNPSGLAVVDPNGCSDEFKKK